MNMKTKKLKELKAQIEALKTMPEGHDLGDGTGRVMTEKRRGRYVSEGQECFENASRLGDHFFYMYENQNILFHDDFMD